jgi:hypothetical protein
LKKILHELKDVRTSYETAGKHSYLPGSEFTSQLANGNYIIRISPEDDQENYGRLIVE